MALPVVDSGIGLREVDPVALVDASGSLYSVRSQYTVVDVDLTVPTSGLAAGDVMADTQVISNIDRVLRPKAGTRDVYVGAIMRTATAQFAGGIVRLRLGVLA
jgi:hypothetical protein